MEGSLDAGSIPASSIKKRRQAFFCERREKRRDRGAKHLLSSVLDHQPTGAAGCICPQASGISQKGVIRGYIGDLSILRMSVSDDSFVPETGKKKS